MQITPGIRGDASLSEGWKATLQEVRILVELEESIFAVSNGCDGHCQCRGEECVQPEGIQEVCVHQEEGRTFGGRRKAVCDSARNTEIGLQGAPRDHRVHGREAEGLLATVERKQNLMSGAPEEIGEKLLHEALVLDDRISAEEAELVEKSEEMKELMMECRTTKAEEWRVSDAAGVDVNWEAASEAQTSGSEIKYFGELEVGVNRKSSLGRRKASADTQEYESCQQNNMEVHKDIEELSGIPSAVSGSAGRREFFRVKWNAMIGEKSS